MIFLEAGQLPNSERVQPWHMMMSTMYMGLTVLRWTLEVVNLTETGGTGFEAMHLIDNTRNRGGLMGSLGVELTAQDWSK